MDEEVFRKQAETNALTALTASQSKKSGFFSIGTNANFRIYAPNRTLDQSAALILEKTKIITNPNDLSIRKAAAVYGLPVDVYVAQLNERAMTKRQVYITKLQEIYEEKIKKNKEKLKQNPNKNTQKKLINIQEKLNLLKQTFGEGGKSDIKTETFSNLIEKLQTARKPQIEQKKAKNAQTRVDEWLNPTISKSYVPPPELQEKFNAFVEIQKAKINPDVIADLQQKGFTNYTLDSVSRGQAFSLLEQLTPNQSREFFGYDPKAKTPEQEAQLKQQQLTHREAAEQWRNQGNFPKSSKGKVESDEGTRMYIDFVKNSYREASTPEQKEKIKSDLTEKYNAMETQIQSLLKESQDPKEKPNRKARLKESYDEKLANFAEFKSAIYFPMLLRT